VRALVTGAGGFLGQALVRRLLKEGWSVRGLSRGDYPELRKEGAETVSADVADAPAVAAACKDVEVVFHTAAKVGLWGRYQDYYRANVEGTRHVLSGCRSAGVKALVFTGSPSVVFDGTDCDGWDESAPYPDGFDSHYSRTKALSEEMALAADGPSLKTISLRPHLIWGPGDRQIFPRIVERGKAGKLRRIKGYNKLVDTTYIDDCVESHWLAAKNLLAGGSAAGRAFFISQGDPRPLWEIIDSFLKIAGVPPVEKEVAKPVASAAAIVLEAGYRVLRIDREPPLTRFLVGQLSTAHWFDISAARRELGYAPKVAIEDGLKRLEAWWKARA
jgi:2-alkyl-3-oxoalkanoate reductase